MDSNKSAPEGREVEAEARVAIPLFENEIAPRFCFAQEILLVEIREKKETLRKFIPFQGDESFLSRLRILQGWKVRTLLCGGFNRKFLAQVEGAGIRVIWGLLGPAEQALEAYLTGAPLPFRPRCQGRGQVRGQGRGQRRGPRGGGCARRRRRPLF
jgi:predicted Fe-Mo cluster-binding NifX family protein